MAAIQLIITEAGSNALAQVGALGPVVLSQIAVGTTHWTPDATATHLQNQVATFAAAGSVAESAGMIHITAEDTSGATYTAYEVGILTSTGVLFAIASSASAILTKTAGSFALFAADFIISGIAPNSVTVGNAVFQYPPATEEVAGVAKVATTAQVNAGTDNATIVTPAKLTAWAGGLFLRIASNLSDLADKAAARLNLGLGSAALLDVPTVGNATAGQVVIGSDTRLNNQRTPTDGSVTAAKLDPGAITAVLQALYPVGEIYCTRRTGNPSVLLGFGTWQAYAPGQVLVGYKAGDANFGTLEQTGGEVTHKLTVPEMPAHTHQFTAAPGNHHDGAAENSTSGGDNVITATTKPTESTGGDGEHNNLQPYIVVFYWKRIGE